MRNGRAAPRGGIGDAPAQPVWAPNPGVPLGARLLAFAFGALMLLTIILSWVYHERPPDVPPLPERWQVYASRDGVAVPYPADWIVEVQDAAKKRGEAAPVGPDLSGGGERPSDAGRLVTFALERGSPVRVMVVTQQFPVTLGGDELAQLRQQFQSWIKSAFSGYREARKSASQVGPPTEWVSFSCRDEVYTGKTVHGAWTIRAAGRRAVMLIALSTPEGWSTMELIIDHMLRGLVVK